MPQHLARKAILYVRQSSAWQVANNLESQRLQYEPPRECRRLRILAVMGDLKYGKRKQGKEAHRDAIFG
jgi:DNA invertase Pin-like site-specific DNA recombinase